MRQTLVTAFQDPEARPNPFKLSTAVFLDAWSMIDSMHRLGKLLWRTATWNAIPEVEVFLEAVRPTFETPSSMPMNASGMRLLSRCQGSRPLGNHRVPRPGRGPDQGPESEHHARQPHVSLGAVRDRGMSLGTPPVIREPRSTKMGGCANRRDDGLAQDYCSIARKLL